MAIFLTMFSAQLFAGNEQCSYSYDAASSKVGFEAFKTYKKAGVKIGFDKVEITPSTKETTVLGQVVGASFTIDTQTVNSANPVRDEKLKSMFFMNGKKALTIVGKVIDSKDDFVNVEFVIGGKKMVVPLKYTITDNKFEAKGTIDMLDFGLSSNLKKINKACLDLHEGKTWSDVNIFIESTFVKNCK